MVLSVDATGGFVIGGPLVVFLDDGSRFETRITAIDAVASTITIADTLTGAAGIGAIVEHDAMVGAGAHVAPGAVALGGCVIGRCAMIGAGVVLLPGATIAAAAVVRALTRYPN